MRMKWTVLCCGTSVLLCTGFLCVQTSTQTDAIREEFASNDQSHAEAASFPCCIYDPNPSHIWNRLHASLLVREDLHGADHDTDSLDPLFWSTTKYLLAAPSHQRALGVLDEFLQTHAENLIHDPVKHVILQRDLWAVFDWSVQRQRPQGEPAYEREKRELQIRLAEVLRRLALTREQMESLPDNYAQAVASGEFPKEYDPAHRDRALLPPDLFEQRGPWVAILNGGYAEPVATAHVSAFSGRSRFLVFVRLPEGRKATLSYFQTLWNFPQPGVPCRVVAPDQTVENPDLPQFPVGTQVALVRQMMLFDSQGNLVPAPITESVQIRVYRLIPARHRDIHEEQDFYEIRFSRPLLFANKAGGLRAIGPHEKEFPIFLAHGPDEFATSPDQYMPLERYPSILEQCASCHSQPGIKSLNSRCKLLKPNLLQHDSPSAYPARWWENDGTAYWKQNRYNWGLLNGYWNASNGPQR
jgi:hypothetical protein